MTIQHTVAIYSTYKAVNLYSLLTVCLYSVLNLHCSSGEFSKPAGLERDNLTSWEKKEWDRGYETAGYNVYVSNRIALRRRVEDTREEM